jgi:hypothetical protein
VVTAELVLDAIKARLDLIVGGSDYNTVPTKQIGVPRDAIPEGAGEKLYLIHGDSETLFDAVGTHHTERATYHVWCVSNDTVSGQRKALRLVRDVQKALRSGFGALEIAGANAGVALGRYMRDEKAEEVTGATVYALTLTADWVVDLST